MFAEDSLDTKSLSLVAVAALSWLWCCGVVVVVHDCACQRKTGVQKVNVLEARWPSLTQHLCSESMPQVSVFTTNQLNLQSTCKSHHVALSHGAACVATALCLL